MFLLYIWIYLIRLFVANASIGQYFVITTLNRQNEYTQIRQSMAGYGCFTVFGHFTFSQLRKTKGEEEGMIDGYIFIRIA